MSYCQAHKEAYEGVCTFCEADRAKMNFEIREQAIRQLVVERDQLKEELRSLQAEVVVLKQKVWDAATGVSADATRPHSSPDDCPTYYDGCNCTVMNLRDIVEERERMREQLAEAGRQAEAADRVIDEVRAERDRLRAQVNGMIHEPQWIAHAERDAYREQLKDAAEKERAWADLALRKASRVLKLQSALMEIEGVCMGGCRQCSDAARIAAAVDTEPETTTKEPT